MRLIIDEMGHAAFHHQSGFVSQGDAATHQLQMLALVDDGGLPEGHGGGTPQSHSGCAAVLRCRPADDSKVDYHHLTVKGRRIELSEKSGSEKATEQFQIHDTRSPAQIAEMLRAQNIDPVWMDFDQVLVQA